METLPLGEQLRGFVYHRLGTESEPADMTALRSQYFALGAAVLAAVPDGYERTCAQRALQESLYWAMQALQQEHGAPVRGYGP